MGNAQSSAIFDAASKDDLARLQEIVRREHIDLGSSDKDGWTPLHFASYWGSLKVLRYLLNSGVNVNAQDKSGRVALNLAAIQDQVKFCIRHSPHYLQSGRTPLHLAAIQGHANAVLGLLTHNADPNLRDDRGMTALHKAAALGHTGAAKDLLKAKADPERKLQDGTTPIFLAAEKGHAEMVEMLFMHGASHRVSTVDRTTPLHAAASSGQSDVVRVLLGVGADASAKNKDGKTPADIAYAAGHHDISAQLIKAGTGGAQGSSQGSGGGRYPTVHKAGDTQSAAGDTPSQGRYPSVHKAGTSAPQPSAAAAPDDRPAQGRYPSVHKAGTVQQQAAPTSQPGSDTDRQWWLDGAGAEPSPAAPRQQQEQEQEAPGRKTNPFLSRDEPAAGAAPGGSASAQPAPSDKPHNPREDFERGLMSAARGVFQFATKGGNQKPRDPIEEAEAKQRHDQQIQDDWGVGGGTDLQRKGLEAQYNLEPYSDAQHHQQTDSGGSKYPSIHKTGGAARPAAKDDITSRLDQLELESLRR